MHVSDVIPGNAVRDEAPSAREACFVTLNISKAGTLVGSPCCIHYTLIPSIQPLRSTMTTPYETFRITAVVWEKKKKSIFHHFILVPTKNPQISFLQHGPSSVALSWF